MALLGGRLRSAAARREQTLSRELRLQMGYRMPLRPRATSAQVEAPSDFKKTGRDSGGDAHQHGLDPAKIEVLVWALSQSWGAQRNRISAAGPDPAAVVGSFRFSALPPPTSSAPSAHRRARLSA